MFGEKRIVPIVVVLLLSMLIGLGGFVSVAGEKTTLTIAITADPRGLNPIFAATFHDWVVGWRLYSSLIQADENFQPVPDLAESWEVSPDSLVYTFHLKQNATFHDGSAITSEDVAFSVEATLEHCSICARGLGSVIESIETPDPYTIVFYLSAPYPEFLNPYDGIGPHCSPVMKKELYEGTDLLTNPRNSDPIGSGPFKFVEWVRGSYIVLERYEGYHGQVPAIERIVFRILGDPMARALAFESGEVDWIPFETPASQVARLNSLPGNNVFFHGNPCGTALELGFNMRKEPFQDKSVRKALTAAIDKDKIANLVYFGEGADPGKQHVSLTSFSQWWYNPEAQQIGYDPELANAILDQAGYPVKEDGWRFRINLKHTTGYTEHLKVAELIKDDFKKIGVDLTIVSLDHAAWHEHVFKSWDFDTTLLPFCSGPTPPSMKRFHTTNILPISWANCVEFSNAEYDVLFNLMVSEIDVEKRLALVHRMQEILAEEQPVAFIVARKNATAIKEGLFTEEPEGGWVLEYLWIHLNRMEFGE